MPTIDAEPYPFEMDPERTALVIIDMQRDFLEPGGFGEALGNDVARLRGAIAPIAAVLGAFRAAGDWYAAARLLRHGRAVRCDVPVTLSDENFFSGERLLEGIAVQAETLVDRPQDRAAFTHFLGSEGYDTTDTTLIYNETQAYLIFTTDPRFFNGSVVGMTQGQIDTLRAGYIAGMPQFWLTKLANETLPIAPAPAACPAGAG